MMAEVSVYSFILECTWSSLTKLNVSIAREDKFAKSSVIIISQVECGYCQFQSRLLRCTSWETRGPVQNHGPHGVEVYRRLPVSGSPLGTMLKVTRGGACPMAAAGRRHPFTPPF